MRAHSFMKIAPFAMMMAFASQTGCGNSGQTMDPGNPVGQTTGYLELGAAKAASRAYLEVNLNIKLIEVLDVNANVWVAVATPNRTINIMDQASIDALLAAHVKVAVGHYTKVRLTLGDGCTVKLADGSIQALNLTAELKAGLVLDVDLDVKVDATIKAFLDLDLNACIQAVVTAGTNTYYLRPLFRIVDRAKVGSITGVVKARVSGTVLAGALVSAEWFDAAGRPHIELTVAADINGRFNLDRLTLGRKYHIVCRPQVGGIIYDAIASAELDLSVAANLTVNLDLDVSASATATASGKVTPIVSLDAMDKVELVEYLTCGTGCNKWFVIDSACAKLSASEDYMFSALAQGRFAIQSSRQHCITGGTCTWDALYISADLNVTAGANLNLDIKL